MWVRLLLAVAVALALTCTASADASARWRYEREYQRGTLKWKYELWRHRVLRVNHGGVGPDLVRFRRPLHGALQPASYRHRVRKAIGRYKATLARRNAPWALLTSTAYCLGGTMSDGRSVHVGAVAMNLLPLGTRVTASSSPYGPAHFTVEDRIGWGTQIDFWVPSCATARAWGRRTVKVWIGWR
jgi:3D (Asp-Asp-Asp) domain-containing protein